MPGDVFKERDLGEHMMLQTPQTHTQMAISSPCQRARPKDHGDPAKHSVQSERDAPVQTGPIDCPIMFCFVCFFVANP